MVVMAISFLKPFSKIIIAVSIVSLIPYCASQKSTDKANQETVEKKQERTAKTQVNTNRTQINTNQNNALSALLPHRVNYKWRYNGFAEYGHSMKLDRIEKNKSETEYYISGTVDDMSDGESKKDFSLKIVYTVTGDTIIQDKKETTMMDSRFDTLEIIKMPLKKDNKWYQTQVDSNGKSHKLLCSIDDITTENGFNTYLVSYRDTSETYYEKRKICEGIGVIWFEKLLEVDNQAFPITYSLYKEASGYTE